MKEVIDYFKKLPSKRIDQKEGFYEEDEPCCIGSHLAHLILNKVDFNKGKNALVKVMSKRFPSINACHINLMFKQCGIDKPWGSSPWKKPPLKVFKELNKIETLPDLLGADLRDANLRDANLRDANLRDADLLGANLRDAKINKKWEHLLSKEQKKQCIFNKEEK